MNIFLTMYLVGYLALGIILSLAVWYAESDGEIEEGELPAWQAVVVCLAWPLLVLGVGIWMLVKALTKNKD